jgi:DNA-binding MarR family transcriptional regulator
LQQTLERVGRRVQQFTASKSSAKLVLRPKQEQLLQLLRAHGSLSPREVWEGISISKQGAAGLLRPLVKAGLVKRVGTLKTGRYVLK